MATLKSIATGNWTSASTWALCDATSEVDSIAAFSLVSTVYTGGTNTMPGIITIDGICVKVYSRAVSASGTFSVELYNATLSASVAGTEVTINVSDIDYCEAGSQRGLWHYFKFSAPVTLLAATNYVVRAKTSVSAQVTLYATGSSNWSRQLVTTTTQAPAAGDKLIIVGDKLSAGSSTSYTVTMDSTAATDYGTGSTSLVSIWVGHNATLSYGTSAATNYILRVSGVLGVGNGGTFNMGSVGAEIPRDSTAVLEFDCTADGDSGLGAYGGTVVGQGLSRTTGKNYTRCFLNTDEAAGQTVLGVDTDTGWKAGDTIVVASTSTTATQYEERILASDATATTVTVTVGLTNAHDGNANVAAEVILLNRNVMIRSVTAGLCGYVYFGDFVNVDLDYVDFRYIGSNNAATKNGVSFFTVNGTATANNCISRNSDYKGFSIEATNAANVTLTDCDVYLNTGSGNVAGFHIQNQTATSTVVLDNCWAIRAASYGFLTSSLNITMNDCRGLNCGGGGMYFLCTSAPSATGTFDGLYFRSNQTYGFIASSYINFTVSNVTCRRNSAYGFSPVTACVITLESPLFIGNANTDVFTAGPCDVVINNGVFAGETGYAAPRMFQASAGHGRIVFNNCTSGVVSGVYTTHTVSCLLATASASIDVVLNDCIVTELTEVAAQAAMFKGEFFALMNNDNVAGGHKSYYREGTITLDTTIYNSASPSQRMTPISAAEKLRSGAFQVAIASGQSLAISVAVRESIVGDGTAYNGTRARLIVKANAAVGIDVDTVLDTATVASVGAWESLSGTTATAATDGVLEFYVDCDGTTGWINVDDWECSTPNDTRGMKYWRDGQPVAYGNNLSGGTSRPSHPLFQQVIG